MGEGGGANEGLLAWKAEVEMFNQPGVASSASSRPPSTCTAQGPLLHQPDAWLPPSAPHPGGQQRPSPTVANVYTGTLPPPTPSASPG